MFGQNLAIYVRKKPDKTATFVRIHSNTND